MPFTGNAVVVTGVGAVASNGLNAKEFYKNCINGITGISKSNIMKEFSYDSEYVAEIMLQENLRWESKFKRIGEMACDEMLLDAGLDVNYIKSLEEKTVFAMASANVGSLRVEPQLRYKFGKSREALSYELNDYSKDNILDFNSVDSVYYFCEKLGIRGIALNVNAACASGTLAIGEVVKMIQSGKTTLGVAAGIDVLSDLSLSGFNSMKNMSDEPCRPFDKERKGITIGEGAAFIMLEEETHAKNRGAKIYGRILGVSSMNEAYHVTAPNPNGEGALWCMNHAIENKNFNKEQKLYINTHGTGTTANDAMEIKAMEKFAENNQVGHIWFSSTKSMIGHCLGAAGSLEFVCSVIGLHEGRMPISISVKDAVDYNSERLTLVRDPSLSVNYDMFISTSYAFAGNMVAICVEKCRGYGD